MQSNTAGDYQLISVCKQINAESGSQSSVQVCPNALNFMSSIVLVQAPDRTLLSWESCFRWVVQSQGPRPRQGPPVLLPNPWSRPSQPGCPIKLKTTSGKQEQWNGDNSVFLIFFISSQTQGGLETFSALDEHISGFTAAPAAAGGSFSTFSRGLVPFWKQ